MQATNLELFSNEDLKPSIYIHEQRSQEEQQEIKLTYNVVITESEKSPDQLFNNIFIDPPEHNNIKKARQLLGENAKCISDKELETFTAKLDYLTKSWLDAYEKQLFDGRTLRELTISNKV